MKRTWRAVCGAALVLMVIGLPVLGHRIRQGGRERCALDGAPIEPVYAVSITDVEGQTDQFCCIHCAQYWVGRQILPPARIEVTDEVTGKRIDSALAHFVRSRVVTTPTTGNRIHAFGTASDAERHRAEHRGTRLTGSQRPLQLLRRGRSLSYSSPLPPD
ncbi:MAG: hypothetical protein WD229_11185 [Pirellulales bacterium]